MSVTDERINQVIPISNTGTAADRPKRSEMRELLKEIRDAGNALKPWTPTVDVNNKLDETAYPANATGNIFEITGTATPLQWDALGGTVVDGDLVAFDSAGVPFVVDVTATDLSEYVKLNADGSATIDDVQIGGTLFGQTSLFGGAFGNSLVGMVVDDSDPDYFELNNSAVVNSQEKIVASNNFGLVDPSYSSNYLIHVGSLLNRADDVIHATAHLGFMIEARKIIDLNDNTTTRHANVNADTFTYNGIDVATVDMIPDTSNFVEKVAGMGLSQNSFTDADVSKLTSLEGSHFRGVYINETALSNIPNPVAGDYADVDSGVENDTERWIYDESDTKWVVQESASSLTAAQVKQLYESNPDTNAFTDTDVDKLANTADKTLPINWLEVSTSTFLIEPEHAGMSLWVTVDCVITVSAHSTLPNGFNCEVFKAGASLIVSVVAPGSDTIRDGKSVIVSDASVFKSPSAGVIGLVGDVS